LARSGKKRSPPRSPGRTTGPTDPAFRSARAVVLFVAIVGIGLAADLWSKQRVFRAGLDDPELPRRVQEILADYGEDTTSREVLQSLAIRRPVCPGVHFSLSTNPGVVFGLPMPPWAVALATAATIALVLYFFVSSDRRAWPGHVGLAFILGGALGNFYDRMFSAVELPGVEPIHRHVRDFIDCSDLYYPWVFNVADVLLVLGVASLALYWLVHHRRERTGRA